MNRFLFIAALIALLSSVARADVVRMNSWQYSDQSSLGFRIQTETGSYRTSAGAIQATLDGDRFLTYSMNLSDSISWGTTYSNYRQIEAGDRSVKWFTEERAADLGRLYTGFASQVNDASSSAAFQLAVWAIVNENGGAYSVLGNGMNVSSLNASNRAAETNVINTAETWLHSMPGYSNYTIAMEYSSRGADLMLVAMSDNAHNVPEPASYVLIATSLVLMSIARRRNAARA